MKTSIWIFLHVKLDFSLFPDPRPARVMVLMCLCVCLFVFVCVCLCVDLFQCEIGFVTM